MGTEPENTPESSREITADLPVSIHEWLVFRYNVDENMTPGGMRVRWKIRVITGPEAARWEARQNTAVLELLRWAHKHNHTT